MEEKKKRIMVPEGVEDRVKRFARERGFRIPRARGVLIEKGLKVVEEDE